METKTTITDKGELFAGVLESTATILRILGNNKEVSTYLKNFNGVLEHYKDDDETKEIATLVQIQIESVLNNSREKMSTSEVGYMAGAIAEMLEAFSKSENDPFDVFLEGIKNILEKTTTSSWGANYIDDLGVKLVEKYLPICEIQNTVTALVDIIQPVAQTIKEIPDTSRALVAIKKLAEMM